MEQVPNKTVLIQTLPEKECALEHDELNCNVPGCSGPYNCEKRKDQWESRLA